MLGYIIESIGLDVTFVTRVHKPFFQKLKLLFKKYLSLLFFPITFRKGNSSIDWFSNAFFPANVYGYVSLQRIYAANHFMQKFIPKDLIVLDIGAHVGEFNYFAKDYLGAKLVYSVEPTAASYQLLEKNCSDHTFKYAISSKKEIKLYHSNVSSQLNTLDPKLVDDSGDYEVVQGIGIDELVEQHKLGRIDLLKIDVEGKELEAIRTATRLIPELRFLLVELSLDLEEQDSLREFYQTIDGIMGKKKYYTLALGDYDLTQRSIDILLKLN